MRLSDFFLHLPLPQIYTQQISLSTIKNFKQQMATKKNISPKDDLRKITNKDKDLQALELAKEQEKKKRLKPVRVDRQTIISVDMDKCPIKAAEEYREKIKRYESNN